MGDIGSSIAAVATAIIGLALVAVLVSQNAQTSSVIQSASQGFGSILASAVAPVSSSSTGLMGNATTGMIA